MTDTTARLGLPLLLPSQAQKHVTHNEALVLLDGIAQLVLQAVDAETAPALPEAGHVYALGAVPLGEWAGQANMLAQWTGAHWRFVAPQEGWRAWTADANTLLVFRGAGGWQSVSGAVDSLGIATTADPVNRLAVASEASLFTHAGAGHQIKLNKATPNDTAALLYQSDWSGRAEMGLTGDDDFHIKLSEDGASWTDAVVLDATTGMMRGGAVQANPTDGTSGRLMPVGAFGLGEMGLPPEVDSLDNPLLPTGFYTVSASAPGSFPAGADEADVVVTRSDAQWSTQSFTYRADAGGANYTRCFDPNTGLWSPWSLTYGQASIVGPVGHAAGRPTGALIEQGSNADGQFVRFANGTQICTHSIDLGDPTAEGSGSFAAPYMAPAGGATLTFARPFITAPELSVTHSVVSGGAGALSRVFTPSFASISATGIVAYRAVRATGDNDTSAVSAHYTAMGRWF